MTVVKVQVPLFSTVESVWSLVYDPKGYFEAELVPGGVWMIGRRVDDQDW